MTYGAALVTGGARRLGRAMALALAERGADVAVHFASSAEAAAGTVADLKALGVNAVALRADLLVEGDMAGLVPAAAAALDKPLDVLINNASVFEYDRLETATQESWDRHFDSNLRAPFVLMQAFADQAAEAATDAAGEALATGCVINMVDQRLRKLTPEFMTYTLAKSGLWTLTQTAARALAPRIRVNAIGPGPTLIGDCQSDAHFAHQRRNTILQRGSNPADIVGAMGFFLDAPSVTGQLICVDGGQHLGWNTPDIQGVT
ncbi:MAG: SDR family oxidoreductase [Rhodobacteraceae bacterium]|nr:SDR family oxidoreductase [Paracoccaceae bacterium]